MSNSKPAQAVIIPPEDRTARDSRSLPGAVRNLSVLNPQGKDREDLLREEIENNPPGQIRQPYAAMRTHKELAAMALAAGSTHRLAAKYAGVSPRQITKYYSEPDFRQRVEEHRQILASKVRGRILQELNRRVSSKFIRNLEIMDLVRILDRVQVGGKGMNINIEGDVNVNNRYEAILAALFDPNAGTEGADFPVYEPSNLRLSSGSSPVDG